MIIVIEGFDGSGKDTVADAVLAALGVGAQRVNFPDDAALTGPAIRSYLKREWGCELNPEWPVEEMTAGRIGERRLGAMAFQALCVANKYERWEQLQAADQGRAKLVCVRYADSAWVYGQLDGLPREFLEATHAALPAPTVSLLLDAPGLAATAWAATCLERRALRDGPKPPERYEGDLAKATTIVQLYRQRWQDLRRLRLTLDASQSQEGVTAEALDALRGLGII